MEMNSSQADTAKTFQGYSQLETYIRNNLTIFIVKAFVSVLKVMAPGEMKTTRRWEQIEWKYMNENDREQ